MARQDAKRKDGPGELLQIVLLTLGMTGGGLMVLFLVLQLFLLPSVQADVTSAAGSYERLTKLLDSDEMHQLRAQAKAQEAAGKQAMSLQQIVLDKLDATGVNQRSVGAPNYARRPGAERREIHLAAARLDQILRFVYGVRAAKKTVEVISVTLNPARRSDEPNVFEATVNFVDYSPPEFK